MFIVAEIGVNWEGDYELLEKLLVNLKRIGCDAVKFQAYSSDMIKLHPLKERLEKSAITESNVQRVNDLCKKVGIEWFCTPMYPEAVRFLDPFVNRYKIRERDSRILMKNSTSTLIDKVLETNKEVIVSVNENPEQSKFFENKKIKWLYCVPKYPCELEEVNFTNIRKFNGYSNHCSNLIAPLTAVILGANILEIHITSDKNKDFIDNPVSFDLKEMEELIQHIRHTERIKK